MNGAYTMAAQTLGLGFEPSLWQLIIILAIGLLIFGHRLPEVGRSMGRSIVEFKKGLKNIEDEVNDASKREPRGRIESDREYREPLPRGEGDGRRVSRADEVERSESER